MFTAEELDLKLRELFPAHLFTFLSINEGITSSHANFIAEKIKAKVAFLQNKIKNFQPYDEYYYDERGNTVYLKRSNTFDIKALMTKVGDLNALAACFRIGVKDKAQILNALLRLDHVIIDTNQYKEELEQLVRPIKKVITFNEATTEDVLSTFTIAERAEYEGLVARAAAIGKHIHPGGVIGDLISSYTPDSTIYLKPMRFNNNIVEIPVTKGGSISQNTFDNRVITLLDVHRELENKLNFYNAKIHNMIAEMNSERRNLYIIEMQIAEEEYQQKLREYESEYNRISTLYNQKEQETALLREALIKRLSAYKVVVPNDYAETYATLDMQQQDGPF